MNTSMVPANFGMGKVSTVLARAGAGDELGAGIQSSFGIVSYRGKVWAIKYQGDEKPLMRPDGDGPRASIEVVIVKASAAIAKIYYEHGYVDGSNTPPDCWSTNGLTPDPASPKKQSTTCAGCPQNVWGSKVTEAGKQTKACSDSKRLAIVPADDLDNELFGGPMLLRVPAASLKDLKMFGDTLQSYGYPYFGVAARISFDHTEAFPKFVFSAIRPLTDDEATKVLELREDPRVARILDEAVENVTHEPAAAALPASPFENGAAPAAAQKQVQQQVQPAPQQEAPKRGRKPRTQPAPQPAPVQQAQPQEADENVEDDETSEEEGGAGAPQDFDQMLEQLLG